MPGLGWFPVLESLYRGDGGICSKVKGWQDGGMSYEKMADTILADHGLRPSPSALQRCVTGECEDG